MISWQSKGLSKVFSNTTVQKHQFFGTKPSFGEGNGTPLQYSCLENPMDGGARWATVHGVEKSQTRLSNFTFPFCFINELHAWIFLLSSNRAHRGSRRAPAGWGGSRSLPGQPAACPPRSLSPPGVPACTGCPSKLVKGDPEASHAGDSLHREGIAGPVKRDRK